MKSKARGYIFNVGAFFNFLIAFALIVLLRLFATEQFMHWYSEYTGTLDRYENWIETHGATLLTVVIILVNYLIKSYIPWFPISCICVASAVIFKWYIAVIINLVGMALYFTVKFNKGRKNGGGKAEEILSRYEKPYNFFERGKLGSKATLYVSRLLPGIPLGAVSVFYGSTEMKYSEYLTVSLLGALYKIMTYITIGRNVFDPASVGFVAPFIPLFLFAGMVLLSIGGVVSVGGSKREKEGRSS